MTARTGPDPGHATRTSPRGDAPEPPEWTGTTLSATRAAIAMTPVSPPAMRIGRIRLPAAPLTPPSPPGPTTPAPAPPAPTPPAPAPPDDPPTPTPLAAGPPGPAPPPVPPLSSGVPPLTP